ncbi:hypothetical protein D3C81_1465800 [compost metagenome]
MLRAVVAALAQGVLAEVFVVAHVHQGQTSTQTLVGTLDQPVIIPAHRRAFLIVGHVFALEPVQAQAGPEPIGFTLVVAQAQGKTVGGHAAPFDPRDRVDRSGVGHQ